MSGRLAALVLICGSAPAADLGPDLLAAAIKGKPGRVAEILAKGAPIESKDKNGRTPLMLAAQHGHAEVVRLLLAKGASLDARDRKGWTAFGLALMGQRDDVLRVMPSPAKLRLVIDARWVPDNLYSSCLMSPAQLAQHVAGLQPEMVVAGALREVASVSAKGMVEVLPEGTGDATLHIKVRPGASCVQQKSADNLTLAVDVRLVRERDQMTLLEKTYGGGLKGLHARSAASPAQYGALYSDWARSHATAIYWAALEAWLRTP